MSNHYPEGHNVGMGMVPHRKLCKCDECELERLRGELRDTKARLADANRDWGALKVRLAEAEEMLRDALAAWLGDGPPINLDRIDAFLAGEKPCKHEWIQSQYNFTCRHCGEAKGQQREGINTDENSDWRERELP